MKKPPDSKTNPPVETREHESRWLSPWVVGILAGFLVVGFGAAAAFASVETSRGEHILPRVRVAGIDLGGLTSNEAQSALEKVAQPFVDEQFIFEHVGEDGKTTPFKATAADLGLVIDVKSSVTVALGIGHRDNYFDSLMGQLVSALGGTDADAIFRFDETTLQGFLGTNFLKVERPARDARLSYKDGALQTIEGRNGHEVDAALVMASLQKQVERLTHNSLQLTLVETQPEVDVTQLADTKNLATRLLGRAVNFYYKDSNFAPPKDEIGSWLEFHTVRPEEVLGKTACACGLPASAAVIEGVPADEEFDIPALLVTPIQQERRGEKPTEPYYVLLSPENFNGRTLSGPMAVVGFNRNELRGWLRETAGAELDVPGQDARFDFENNQLKVTKASTAGTGVDVDQAMLDFVMGITADKSRDFGVKLALHQTKPEITEDKINELGIETLIGRGISDASNSPANRFHNIDVGLEKFDGVVIAPDEEFSTLGTLGPVDAANGFLPELVILGNKITPQYGGGLCQVSSTLFRAALDTGLEITDRTNHAFSVSHYLWPYNDYGVEATIFEPAPDLRFINDTGAYILIDTYRADDDKVYFDFYGTDPGRTTTIDGPYRLSGSPSAGGQTTFTYTVTDDETGKVIRQKEYVSTFQPLSKFKLTD